MREPIQALIIPYTIIDSCVQVLILKRTKGKYWQFISGGMESGETLEDTVRRETYEEIGEKISDIISLQTKTIIPANAFGNIFQTNNIFVIEHTFAIKLEEVSKIILSHEHDEFRLVHYEEAMDLLKWDSNKTALYELFRKMCWAIH